ncbi:MAG: DUF2520 domain-containing protein [Bacteroidetes bacterium]|jgi:predicted short-subunit dehydrogenase-like oxidoreductase (DUF2520 family)|nr:DUF2520 domain-containing protein [Bacteroidota bacterium]
MQAKADVLNVVIVGSGNVAMQLAMLLNISGNKVVQVVSRNSKTGKQLAKLCNCDFNAEVKAAKTNADICLIAVNDDSIAEVVRQLPEMKTTVVHTSGLVPIDVLKKKFRNCGVMYPVQSLTAHSEIFSELIFCVEASGKKAMQIIEKVLQNINCRFVKLNSAKREKLHLAAVIVNNFTNHLYSLAYDYLKHHKIDFNILQPLIENTALRIESSNPSALQTGPALRGDRKTIQRHLQLLKNNPELADVYKKMTKSIEKNRK